MTVTIKHRPAPPATAAEAAAAPAGPRVRLLSGIASPYFDHDSSLKVADVVQNIGGGNCGADFLASKLGYKSVRSGTFLTRVAASRAFGYITTNNGKYVITERGQLALAPVMPEDGINAKADAFLAIPLFQRMYDDFKGRTIPPEVGLKNLFLNTYKILPDRVSDAVRIFMNSAEQCGYFHAGRDRLIRPIATVSAPTPVQPTPPAAAETPPPALERRTSGSGGDGGGGIHSALVGLLRELPKSGESWTVQEQTDFIAAFTGLIKFIFPARRPDALDKLLNK